MGPGEKKLSIALAGVLLILIGAYFVMQRNAATPTVVQAPEGAKINRAAAPQAGGGSSCEPGTVSANAVPTQVFGKKGAKLEIVACLPITHHCHDRTEQTLKDVYKAHPNDIHLTIYDLFGKEGQEYVKAHGGQRAVVFIDGKTSFQHDGKTIKLERQEGQSYAPDDIAPIVEDYLKGA